MKKISADFKAIIGFTLPFGITVLLFIIMLKFGLGKISELRLKVGEAKKNQTILSQKLSLLSQVEESVLSSSSASVSALPESNSSLSAISQLKGLSSSKEVLITNLKTGSEAIDKSGLKRIDISLDMEGRRDLLLEFLNDIQKLAPIMLTDKIKINESAGVSRGTITIKAFWSDLPKSLPPLGESLKDLTVDERNTLAEISTLIQPTFVDVPASDTQSIRQDPFSF